MTLEGVLADPRTLVAAAALVFAVFTYRWNRRENRLEALSKILHPMIRAAQELQVALNTRQRCEVLRRSFPRPEAAPEAAERVNKLVVDYGEHLQAGSKELRTMEAEFVSRSFRFPDNVAKLVQKAMTSLSEMG